MLGADCSHSHRFRIWFWILRFIKLRSFLIQHMFIDIVTRQGLIFFQIFVPPITKIRWPTTVTATTKSSRQKQKAHGKNKKLTAKTKSSRQKQKARGKNKKLTAKTKCSRQKQNARGKNKMLAAKTKSSRQKQNAHGKSKKLTAKVKSSRQK